MKIRLPRREERPCWGVIPAFAGRQAWTAHKGGLVSYHDPYIPRVKTNEGREFISEDLSTGTLAEADCVVLTTNHKDFDVMFIQKNSRLIVDMRNMIIEGEHNIYKL